ncbi:hypothetical protein [Lysobacter sp. S4-A87]|uniref:hypothetical protein n=1 Tax=Lysobacter sp. S4-A87 TaxID=2925843 RepID=UPI0027382887|nr:hypothetical protein [Lysobacter sp. S4-A87]
MSSGRPISEALRTLATNLKLDVGRLERGETLKTTVVVPTPQEMKKLLAVRAPGSDFDRIAAALELTDEHPDSYEAGLKHFSAYLCGVSELDTSIGSAFFKKRFPMTVHVAVAQTVEVKTDVVIEPGSPPHFVSCDDLIFDGGSYVVQNTNFTLWVTNELKIKSSGGRPYHIGILGAPGGDGPAGPNAEDQKQAPRGKDAPVPSPGVCTGAGSGGDGTEGNVGYTGGKGEDAKDGLPSLGALINIANFATLQAPLVLFGMSGRGGTGGKGGNGGRGQQGGDGGNGCKSGCEGTDGGNGRNGGNGGTGGNGGKGGNSVNGGLINLNINSAQKGPSFFVYTGQQSSPGGGGAAGEAGWPGDPGKGGEGGHGSSRGKDGNTGLMGSPGTKGQDGGGYGTAPQLIPGTYVPPESIAIELERGS